MTTLEHDWFPGAVPDNVILGEGTWLHSTFAFRHYRSTRPIGLATGRHVGMYIGTLFDLGNEGELTIGDYTMLGGVVVSTNGRVAIGSYTLLSYDVGLAGHDFATPPGSEGARDEPILIGDDGWIGARAVILGGTRLGRGVIVGAASVVRGEIPDYAVVAGSPARIIGEAPPGSGRGRV